MKITHTPIDSTLLNTPPPASARRGTAGPDGTTVAAGGPQSSDQPGYQAGYQASYQSSLGASVVGLTARALAQPEVRGDVVAHFRGQIASGAYQPDAAQTAGQMLADPLTDL